MMNSQNADNGSDIAALELAKTGMPLRQLINMLEAAYSQGARYVVSCKRIPGAAGLMSAVDWVSPGPVGEVVYIGATGTELDMSNAAMESLDW